MRASARESVPGFPEVGLGRSREAFPVTRARAPSPPTRQVEDGFMADESRSLQPGSAAPHQSRVIVRDFLARQDADQLAEVSDLLTSELVSNVVRHAQSTVQLEMHWDDDTLRVEVRDGSSILPAVVDLAGA